jgi:hypothetical protein
MIAAEAAPTKSQIYPRAPRFRGIQVVQVKCALEIKKIIEQHQNDKQRQHHRTRERRANVRVRTWALSLPAFQAYYRGHKLIVLVIVLAHLLLLFFLLHAKPPVQKLAIKDTELIYLPDPIKPKPQIKKPIEDDAQSGKKLAQKPKATLPTLVTPAEISKPTPPPLEMPNLASINEPAAPTVGTGGTGKEGSGASDRGKSGKGNQLLFADCADSPDRAIVAGVFELPVGTQVLPDFSHQKRLKTICLAQLNISPRKFTAGFPGLESLFEWFGLDIHFRLKIPETGSWDFALRSDDGSTMQIDGENLIDNDGIHSPRPKAARVVLNEGLHDVHIRYFQGPRDGIALELFWKPSTEKYFAYIAREQVERPRTN